MIKKFYYLLPKPVRYLIVIGVAWKIVGGIIVFLLLKQP